MEKNVRKSLKILKDGELVEVRIIGTTQGTVSGYFNNYDKLAQAIVPYNGKNDIYMTLNPVKVDLLARSENKLKKFSRHTTTDSDIQYIKYILVDLDPIRPSGISSSNSEKEAASEMLKNIIEYLKQVGMKNHIKADSGNGYHLLVPIKLENSRENIELIKTFLKALDLKFTNDQVEVDLTTYNASRIVKLYGTMATKGDSTEDRPHRYSQIIGGTKKLEVNSLEFIRKVTDTVVRVENTKKTEGSRSNKRKAVFDIDAFIEKHELDLSYKADFHGDGQKWILKTCPFNPEHTDNAAYIIQFHNGAIAAGCHHNGCSGKNWKDLRLKYGNSVGDVNPEVAGKNGDDGKTQVDELLSLADEFDYFKDELDEHYVATRIGESREVLKIDSARFKYLLIKRYRDFKNAIPGDTAISSAIQAFKVESEFSENIKILEKRVASEGEDIYYDLGNNQWNAIKLNKNGVTVEQNPPTLFTRTKNMAEQVLPDLSSQPERLLELLERHFRVKSRKNLVLLGIYIVTAFIPNIGHPVLVLHGEKGAGKSTSIRLIKNIVDPAQQDLLVLPNSDADLAITLSNNYMPAFDNIDKISPAKSDILCQAATGGAFSKRKLYADNEETILSFKRAIVLNGINVVATRPDLLDRSILIELERVRKEDRQTERYIFQNFKEDLPCILGSIFNTLSKAISIRKTIKLAEVGRMADFNYWGVAVAEALGIGGEEFQKAYLHNQKSANYEAIESHPIAAAILSLMNERDIWQGSVSNLLEALKIEAQHNGIDMKNKLWANDANVLSRRLNEIKSNLQEEGIFFNKKATGSYKEITIENRNYKGDR